MMAQQYTVSTIAGANVGGVVLNNPCGVAVDVAGNVYFSDWNAMIRKIPAAGGAAIAIAGTGTPGYSGDGGPATAATLQICASLTIDYAGNIYIADALNNRIRRIDASTGIITTIAGTGAQNESGDGGPATAASVFWPSGVVVDGVGNVYFGSHWSYVRKVDATTGVISTIAGQMVTSYSGDGGPAIDAQFWDPTPGALDSVGDIYLADYENSRIRKIAANTGIVTTVAGSGSCTVGPLNATVCKSGYLGDGSLATGALLNYPAAVARDAAGNLFIADTINHRIRRVDAYSGVITTIAGTGTKGFSGDGGPALDAELSLPAGIAVDNTGKVYFTDENNGRVRMLTPLVSGTRLRTQLPRPVKLSETDR
ncbi:MAG TPA: hypothetical protein VFC46_01780 [Humisphaera sp.]|nr:hypothetical protein [Humisphaera sp.]